jgi:uncharacterized cupin superfamily protein
MANHPSVVGDGDLEWGEQSHAEKFGYRRKQLSRAAGGEKLGCSLYEVPPGRRAWPYHYHLANEEAKQQHSGRTKCSDVPSGPLRLQVHGDRLSMAEGNERAGWLLHLRQLPSALSNRAVEQRSRKGVWACKWG